MKVFIAWSGNSSKSVAVSLYEWLPSVLPCVKPWMSEKDIAKGTIWNAELWKHLKSADFGILCLVPDNVTKPWVIFEAGALSGGRAYDKVSPFLLGIKDSDLPSPLRQFQCTRFSIGDVRDLVGRLNVVAKGNERLDEQELKKLFQRHWPNLRKKLTSIDLTQGEKETEDASKENSQLETKKEQLDDVHISILRTLALSSTAWDSFTYLQLIVRKAPRVLASKVNDLIRMGFVIGRRKRRGRRYSYSYAISEEGVKFLDAKKLLSG